MGSILRPDPGGERMARVADNMLFRLIQNYLTVFLPTQKACSPHTLKAYRTSLNMLLDFAKKSRGITLSQISFDVLDSTMIQAFLDYCEKECGNSAHTRNYKLDCIRAFFKYAAMMEPCAVTYHFEVKKIVEKVTPKNKAPEYMSEVAVKAILNQPNPETKNGLRDQFFMILLYDTGTRIQEILNMRVKDVHVGKTSTVTVFGKGSKLRTIPIMEKTVAHFHNYISAFHANKDVNAPLFYILRNGEKHPMSDDNVRRFMQKYAAEAQRECAEVPDNVYPHLWRHSRAMHLYQHGTDLTMISQWLGHAHLETTLIYASADTEHKRRAIEKALGLDDPILAVEEYARYKVDDETTLKRLYGLL